MFQYGNHNTFEVFIFLLQKLLKPKKKKKEDLNIIVKLSVDASHHKGKEIWKWKGEEIFHFEENKIAFWHIF